MVWLRYLIIAVVAYFLGNFSSGVLISKWVGHTDIREHGSGGTGATNMLRTLGWFPSVMTLLGDALKAALAALFGKMVGGEIGMLIGGVAAIVGHNWPVLFGFHGGKGIAASLGMLLVCSPWIGLILLAQEIIIIAITRYVSVASIIAAVTLPVYTVLFYPHDTPRLIASVVVALLALFSHRANIARLIRNNENRLDFHKIHDVSVQYDITKQKKRDRK